MNLPDDLLRLVLGMALLIPLSYALRYIRPTLRYWYSLVLSLLLQIYVFRSFMYPIYIQHLIVFAIIKYKGPKCGLAVTVESMVFLSAYQINQIFTNYGGWTMNASALLMILVCKYSLLAYNLQDGAIKEQEALAKLSPEQKRYRITSGDISFMDFIGYCNFLPSCLVGPPFQYQDYIHFMNNQEAYSWIPTYGLNKKVLQSIGETVLCALVFGFAETFCPLSGMREDAFYNNSFWYVFFYTFFSVSLARFKYYFGWKLTMCAMHASGVSYNGTDFNRINSVNIIVVETSMHVRQKINNWNIHVQQWLNRCIYLRHDFKNKTKNQLFVFVISAFWHGFYGAYYLSFVFWFAQLYVQGLIFNYCKNERSVIVQIYKKSGKVGKVVLSFFVQLLFSHSAAFFLVLHGPYCIKLLLKLKFIPQLALIAFIVAFNILKPPREPKAKLPADKESETTKKEA